MKIETLEGRLLDAAVAMSEGWTCSTGMSVNEFTKWFTPSGETAICAPLNYSSSWVDGGSMLDKHEVSIQPFDTTRGTLFGAAVVIPNSSGAYYTSLPGAPDYALAEGPTILTAAMRAIAIARLGKELAFNVA